MSRLRKVKKILIETITKKRLVFFFLLVLIFNIKLNQIVLLIENYLQFSSDFSSYILDVFIIIFAFSVLIYFLHLIWKRGYNPSFIQLSVILSLVIIIIYFYNNRKTFGWNYHKIEFVNIEYIWLIVVPLITFILSHLLKLFVFHVENEDTYSEEFQIVNDSPINSFNEDILGFMPLVDKLESILYSQKSEKSISIGLIGPWGNGKSSVIELLKEKFNTKSNLNHSIFEYFKKNKYKNFIVVHFLPYLNHNENDLISEFFIELSNKLKPFNGKLSNLVIEYSKKLIELYNKKFSLDFIDKHISSSHTSSARKMYEEINSRLSETGKKIIVFVDDLDRLSENEILQVLKLIRNSADFKNVIFLIALDKEYVLNLLLNKKQILSSRFIDKFFQLEVYLPALRSDVLKDYFLKLLQQKTLRFSEKFRRELTDVISSKYTLTEDYIKNVRDVKRTVNQIVYEHPFINDEINLKDFINYTFFKLKYPRLIQMLHLNKFELLERIENKPNYIELKKTKPVEGSNNSSKSFWLTHDKYDVENLKNYKIYSDIIENEKDDYCKFLSEYDEKLILKTLSFLFGPDNKIESTDSIKRIDNFTMLIEQRIFDNHMTNQEFKDTIKLEGEVLNSKTQTLFQSEKLKALTDRLVYFVPQNGDEFRAVIELYAYLYMNRRAFSLYDSILLKNLALQVDSAFVNKENSDNTILILKNHLFENKILNYETKLFLLTELWAERRYNNLWDIGQEYIIEISIRYYKLYLDELNNNLWDLSDYTFYYIGNNLRKIQDIKLEVNELTVSFWQRNRIELMCSQNINIEAWTSKAFTLSDNVVDIYGSKDDYIDFIRNHKYSSTDAIKEILDFLTLLQITDFRKKILYQFYQSNLMLNKVMLNDYRNKSDEFSESSQVLFETNLNGIIDILTDFKVSFSQNSYGDISTHKGLEKEFIFIHFQKGYIENEVEAILNDLINAYFKFQNKNFKKIINKRIWRFENILENNNNLEDYFILKSLQPSIYREL